MEHPEHGGLHRLLGVPGPGLRGRAVLGRVAALSYELKFVKALWEIRYPEVHTPRLEMTCCAQSLGRVSWLSGWGCFTIIRQAVRRGGEMRVHVRQRPAAVSHRSKTWMRMPSPSQRNMDDKCKTIAQFDLQCTFSDCISTPKFLDAAECSPHPPIKDLCIRYFVFLFLPLKHFWSSGFWFLVFLSEYSHSLLKFI